MDAISLKRINLLHPKVRQEVLAGYTYVNSKLLGKKVRCRLAYTLRTHKEQDELYAQGRTILFDQKGKRLGKVTGAKGGQSIHNYGLAFDIVLLIDLDGSGSFKTASWDVLKDVDGDGQSDWMEVVNYFKKLGWTWGGDWKSMIDPPHLEKTFGYGWKELQAKVSMGETFTEVIDGVKYNWVKI
jgi:peptidoglycan L-alanyl-D-glutamate endopeptidase CwlK